MKRHLSILAAVVVLIVLTATVSATTAQKTATLYYNNIKITLDGEEIVPTDANGKVIEPFAIDGTTYLPVRGISNALGLSVEWDDATQTVILKSKDAADHSSAPVQSSSGTSTSTQNETISQKNAVKTAKSYLDYTAFSRSGLIKQLEYEKYSHDDAVYGADHSGADWFEQAGECAKSYLDYMSFSRDGLIKQLEYEGFTHDQAVYGVSIVGY